MYKLKIICFSLLMAIVVPACIKEYLPPELQSPNRFLIVEGIINATPDSPTLIKLSRTRNLTDSALSAVEPNALVAIEEENGSNYLLQENANGVYILQQIPINPDRKYRLRIRTSDGTEYESDFVQPLRTPPIDSISWRRDDDEVTFFASTRDPQNQTRFYRWDFDETWEYNSEYESFIGFRNGQLFFRDSTEFVRTCWRHASSVDVLVASSGGLTEDVINEFPLTTMVEGSEKLGQRYSMLLRQYAIDQGAYEYWQILRRNSQELGSIFDPQPSQIRGNIRCITRPGEPVLGYVSASTITEYRIFVRQQQIGPWTVDSEGNICTETITSVDSAAHYLADGRLAPYYYITGGGISLVHAACVDCTVKGGSNRRPDFW